MLAEVLPARGGDGRCASVLQHRPATRARRDGLHRTERADQRGKHRRRRHGGRRHRHRQPPGREHRRPLRRRRRTGRRQFQCVPQSTEVQGLPQDARRRARSDRRGYRRHARPCPRRGVDGGDPGGKARLLPEAVDSHAVRMPRADEGRSPGRRRHPDGQPGTRHRGRPVDQRVDSGRGHRRGPRGPRLVGPGGPPLEAGHRPAEARRRRFPRPWIGTSGWGRSPRDPITRRMPR